MSSDLRRVAKAVLLAANYNGQGEALMRRNYEERLVGKMAALDLSCNNLRFNKTGKQIIDSLKTVIENNNKDIEALQVEVAEICKRRELDPKEVMEVSKDAEKFQAYSTALYNNGPQASSALKALESDLNRIRFNVNAIGMTRGENDSLERLRTNLEPTRTFDLTYDELVKLGF